MGQVKFLSPRDDIVEAAAAFLEPLGKDYSRSLVVFPGKRPAHFLRKVIADREKTSIIPPRVLSIDAFIESMFRMLQGTAPRILTTLDAVALLFQVHMELPSRRGGR